MLYVAGQFFHAVRLYALYLAEYLLILMKIAELSATLWQSVDDEDNWVLLYTGHGTL
jgi:hypothetical protein